MWEKAKIRPTFSMSNACVAGKTVHRHYNSRRNAAHSSPVHGDLQRASLVIAYCAIDVCVCMCGACFSMFGIAHPAANTNECEVLVFIVYALLTKLVSCFFLCARLSVICTHIHAMQSHADSGFCLARLLQLKYAAFFVSAARPTRIYCKCQYGTTTKMHSAKTIL